MRRMGLLGHAACARALAGRMRVVFAPRRLEKIRETRRQSGLSLNARAGNVRGASRARGKPAPRVLLVDDVATSGATARECAGTLIAAGARAVDVWCLARASRDDLIADELAGAL